MSKGPRQSHTDIYGCQGWRSLQRRLTENEQRGEPGGPPSRGTDKARGGREGAGM